jgi:type II secretory pathway pseudopilin PulG
MKKIFKKFNNKGQSLVEVVVACGIIGITLVAMMSIMSASRNLLYASEDQTKATALAQEAIEIAKHQRDIGCSFDNIKDDIASGTIDFIIKGDTEGSNDETLQTSGTPSNIKDFDKFSRYIIIEDLSSNSIGIDTSSFNTNAVKCSDPNEDYDCLDKYYAIRIDVYKDGDPNPISQVETIMSKQ